METSNIIKEITLKIIHLLHKVVSEDVQYWLPLSGLAYNPISKHTYTSINQLLLSYEMYEKNYSINNWMTFKQINAFGGSILKDEEATPVTFSEVIYLNDKGDKLLPKEAKQAFVDAKEKDPTISTYLEAGINTKRFLRYYFVFNVAQTKGLSENITAPQLANLKEHERFDAIDSLAHNHGVVINHVVGNNAYFSPSEDHIRMPFLKQFSSTEHYYSTLCHELIHWSGHEKRLNRVFGTRESEEYAFEELIAELGSTFLCAHFQIPASLTSSAAYIKSWLVVLKDDNSYLLKAIGYSERAMNYLLSTPKEPNGIV